RKAYYHLVLLAKNATGYKNLVKLSSLAYTEGFYSRPRVDRELLARYNEGIIVSSACMAGEVANHLLADNWVAAREAAAWYANTFRDYYLEVQAHTTSNQAELNQRVFRLAEELGIPVVATNDAHFLRAEDHAAHDVLLCIGLGKDHGSLDRMRYNEGLYFKNAGEIASSFPGRPDVLENTVRIGEDCAIEFTKKYQVPAFPLPEGASSENDLLIQLSTQGARAVRRFAPGGSAAAARL
ncbi:MAG: PHP domain-containing protein, partial [Gemmatimonadaceae bacterium]|nr:PHP domain-containing protein [Gemmatimonadaceae bacterium]